MTIRELIGQLQQFPLDREVQFAVQYTHDDPENNVIAPENTKAAFTNAWRIENVRNFAGNSPDSPIFIYGIECTMG